MQREAYDCIVACLGSSSASKILKGVPKGDGAGLLKKLHAAKGSVEHQIRRWDNKLERLTLVAMNGWIDFRDEWLESADGRNNIDELEEDDILLTKFSLESSTGNCKIFFLLFFNHVFVTLLLLVIIV